MSETVLFKSGDLYFSQSDGGSNTPLPSNKKVWLNDQILDMYQQILDLETTLPGKDGKDGKDGHSAEFKYGVWPEGMPDEKENYWVQWKWMDRDTFVDTWKPLISYVELKGKEGAEGPAGPQGPEGPEGPQGVGVPIKGTVLHKEQLVHLPSVDVGDGYIETSTSFVWRLREPDWKHIANWDNLGKIVGPKGDKGQKGDRGARGPEGPKGEAGGGISQFLVQWMVDTATNAAVSAAMNEVMSTVNDAINTAIDGLMNEMQDMVNEAVSKAVEDAMEDLKGEKGDKGDKGDKGKDGASVRLVGHYEYLTSFQTQYPAIEDNVGVAALIGKDHEKKELWSVSKKIPVAGAPAFYSHENLGDIQGPKGDDAEWTVSVRDDDFVEKMEITVESGLPSGVAGMYMQESKDIKITGTKGSPADPKQVGFKLEFQDPLPKPVKEGSHGVPTKGKVIGNDGEKYIWVDGGTGGGVAEEEILLKGADGRIWSLNVDDDGRLHQDLSVNNTDKVMLQVVSPNRQKWGITIDNVGRLNIEEVF